MESPIRVTYEATNSAYKANQILRTLEKEPIIAWDLEVAIKYTTEELLAMELELEEIEKRMAENSY